MDDRPRAPDPDADPDPDPDIERYPPDEGASLKTDIPGYPDIRGYPIHEEGPTGADSDRYPPVAADQESAASRPVGLPEGAPLFKDSGFESLDDYLEHMDELWRSQNGLPPLFPDGLGRVRPRDGHGSRQVGLRLPETDFRRLRELGDEYGVAPATMARMIVVGALRSRRVVPDD